jgi:hypothetical protein
MDIVTSELIKLFSFLLPGFITSFLFYSLTSFPKKSEFEAVVIALIHTIIINTLVKALEFICLAIGNLVTIGNWNQISETFFSVIFAVCIGLLWSYLYNNDIIHKHLRKRRITNQSSYPSEWYGTFSETKSFVILDLKDRKRITGWPVKWPHNPDQGHFVLQDAKWLVEQENRQSEIPLITIEKIMINVNDVEMVEFVKNDEESGGN